MNFDSGSPKGWDWISDPLLNSGEAASFYTPLAADPKVAGTVFDGLQHVWRTTDNGGKRAYLQKHCNEISGDFRSRAVTGSRSAASTGDLSGKDPGNYVVAVERAADDTGTLWAGTRLGRIYCRGTPTPQTRPSHLPAVGQQAGAAAPLPVRDLRSTPTSRTTSTSPTRATRRTRRVDTSTR